MVDRQYDESMGLGVPTAETTLNGTRNSTVTQIIVNDLTIFPTTESEFRVQVEDEIMLAYGVPALANRLQVYRGIDGTTAATHNTGAVIKAPFTQGGLDRMLRDRIPMILSENKSVNRLVDKDNNELVAADWSAEGDGTKSDNNTGMNITITEDVADANDPYIVYKSIDSADYRIETGFTFSTKAGFGDTQNDSVSYPQTELGIGLRDTVTGDMLIIVVRMGTVIVVDYWTDATTFDSHESPMQGWTVGSKVYFRIDTSGGTDVTFYVSMDGTNWVEFLADTTTFTNDPDEVLFFANADECEFDSAMNIFMYSETVT